MVIVAEEELDELYSVRPEDFTALRAELATAAKRRGDKAAAKRIAGARRPTTAAWIVNQLARRNEDARHALTDLGERLRAAHGAMAGDRIRALSAEQRRLVDELARAAFEAAEVAQPSAALRDDVTGMLQAAIADPELAARLGRLAKAERWSGFGEFVQTAPVSAKAKSKKITDEPADDVTPQPEQDAEPDDGAEAEATRRALERERQQAREAVAAAERARDKADAELSERAAQRAAAQERVDEIRHQLEGAESELTAAQDDYDDAGRASHEAADLLEEATARLDSL